MSGLAFPKPRPAALERQDRRTSTKAAERREKANVRQRDVVCRWPRCECYGRLEVAHLRAKGMGGDHGLRSTADQMILLCYAKHQGTVSLHSGDLRIVPLTDAGTDGPCRFDVKHGTRWRSVAAEHEEGGLR